MTTIDELLGALDALERQGGELKGPWSLGQALLHCAQSVDCSLTGFPQPRGWLVRAVVGPLVKRRFLRAGRMSHDLTAQIPGVPPLPPTSTADGAAALRRSLAAFRAHSGPMAPHFAYGEVSKAEYEALHAMHAAEHLEALTR
jgi:hypothetical protein